MQIFTFIQAHVMMGMVIYGISCINLKGGDSMSMNENQKDLEIVKVFVNNLMKSSNDNPGVRANPCNENCDCYVELEITRAAGIAGYRYGM